MSISESRGGMRARMGLRVGSGLVACALMASMLPTPALAATATTDGDEGLVATDDERAVYGGAVAAALTAADTVTIAGWNGYRQGRTSVAGMQNPTATITRGEVVYATDAPVASDGTVSIAGELALGTYSVVLSSDNYQPLSFSFAYPQVQTIEFAGVGYEWLDASTAFALVDDAEGKAATLAASTQIADSGIYYKPSDGQKALAGTLYGTDVSAGAQTSYSQLYATLTGAAHEAGDYDAISSATGLVNNAHYGQLSTLVARSIAYAKDVWASVTSEQMLENKLVGAYVTTKTVDATGFVEASILKAAGKADEATTALVDGILLNGNATVDPATVTDRVAVDTVTTSGFATGWSFFDPTALSASKAYGHVKLVVRPTTGANTAGGAGFSWADYYQHVYAGTLSHNGVTVGMAPWIDLYTEAGHSAVEISLSNGTNPYNGSNKATVNRYATFYDDASGRLEAGSYTVTVYAAGYNPLSYTFDIPEVVPADDLASIQLKGIDATSVTVTSYALNETGSGNAALVGETYATDAAAVDGRVTLDKPLVLGDYKVVDNNGVVYTFSVAKRANTLAVTAKVPKALTFSTKAQTLANPLVVSGAQGTVSYAKASGNAKISVAADGKITVAKNTPAGSYPVAIVVSATGDDTHEAGQVSAKVTIKVNKAAGKLVVKAVKATQAASAKKATTLAAKKVFKMTTNLSGGALTYAKSSGNKKITVSKAGVVKVAKGLKAGSYPVKVKVSSAATKNYQAATTTVSFKVVVK